MAVELALVAGQTVDEALLDQRKVGSERRFANQTVSLLLLDALADLLTHVLELRVVHVLLHTLVDVLDQVSLLLAERIVGKNVHGYIAAVEQTERIVERVVEGLELDCLRLARACTFDRFAGFLGRALRSGILILEEQTGCIFVHHGGVTIQAVDQTLEEQLLVERPSRIVGQTGLLALSDARTDVFADTCCLGQLRHRAVVTGLQCVNELRNSLSRTVVAEVVRFDLCTVSDTQSEVDRVVHVR